MTDSSPQSSSEDALFQDMTREVVAFFREDVVLTPAQLHRLGRILCQTSGLENPQPDPMPVEDFLVMYVEAARGKDSPEAVLIREGVAAYRGGAR